MSYGLLIQFYGISKQPENNEYLIIKQYAQNGSLYDYIVDNFDNIDWEIKLHLLYYLAEDLKALHNAGYVHRNFHPFNVLVFDNSLCAIGSFSKCWKDSIYTYTNVFGNQHYMAPEFLSGRSYTKASDIYSLGMIMYTVGTGRIPFIPSKNFEYHIFMKLYICHGMRPIISNDIPKSYKELIVKYWNPDPDLRPDISEIHDTLLKWWSSVYHNSLTPICLEFLTTNKIQKPTITKETKELKDIVLPNKKNLEPSEFIDFIVRNHFVKFINLSELSIVAKPIESGHFGIILKTIWKKTNNEVVCKRLKNIESINYKQIEAFLHELNMHRRLDFCSRIIRILGI
ncbi:kinase-like domain-containing protein, partial [Rhizophagus irregularis DAOM 181602=DAOM 197198]